MRFTVRLLGLDLIDICISTDPDVMAVDELGESTAYPVGFTLTPAPLDHDFPQRPGWDD